MENINDLSLSHIASLIRKKEVSPVEITTRILNKIEEENPGNNAFISICNEIAVEDAKAAEKEIVSGNYKGPLHGVPLAMKDNISVKNTRCTNGSIISNHNISQNDALLVQQLRYQGAVIVGKTNLDEYANNVVGKNKHYGTIKNPLNADYSVGGSSGGSAVAVASNLSYGAIGTDTSGSIRIPAACCGVVGLKPTYNLIPTAGVTPLSWSLDHAGVLARNCVDLSIIFQSLVAGSKPTYLDKEVDLSQLTIGVPENYFFELLDVTVEKKIREVIEIFINQGANVKQVTIPNIESAINAQEKIIGTEGAFFHQFKLEENKDKYEVENYEYFKHGLTISNKQYNEALKIRQKMNKNFQQVFDDIDILLTPTLPITTPKLTAGKINWGEQEEDILSTMSRYTGPFNVSGLPALSVPVGYNTDGLSIGLQIVGNMYSENQLIAVGNWIMKELEDDISKL
ncbi:amidase [Virgibacillus sp. W0181]|uniref:amidase n=1 Tax=Virgibacillus sp. W0181 TaxID=3391581 RepID=UPI003F460C2B